MRASAPYGVVGECLGSDWGAKDVEGRELRLSISLHDMAETAGRLGELLARIDKVLSRHLPPPDSIRLGDIEIFPKSRSVTKAGQPLELTPTQYDLLLLLAKNKNVALSRERILSEIWNSDFIGESRAIDNHISQLRRRTGLPIVAVSRVGYRLETDEGV